MLRLAMRLYRVVNRRQMSMTLVIQIFVLIFIVKQTKIKNKVLGSNQLQLLPSSLRAMESLALVTLE